MSSQDKDIIDQRQTRRYRKKFFLLAALPLILAISAIAALVAIQSRALADREIDALETQLIEAKRAELKNYISIARTAIGAVYGNAAPDDEMSKTQVMQTLAAMIYGQDGYFFVFDYTPVVLIHDIKPENVGKDLSNAKDGAGKLYYREMARVAQEKGQGFVDYTYKVPNEDATRPKLSFVKAFKPWGWVVATGIYIDDVNAVFMKSLMVMAGVAAAVLLAVVGISLMISRGITVPLFTISDNMIRLAGGDHKIEVLYTDQKSEIGDLARSMETFRDKTIEMEEMRIHREEQERNAEIEKREALRAMADNFEASVGPLRV